MTVNKVVPRDEGYERTASLRGLISPQARADEAISSYEMRICRTNNIDDADHKKRDCFVTLPTGSPSFLACLRQGRQ
jgi:hypothetical protein